MEIKIKKPDSKQVICLIVDNQPNVLARISSLIGRRNFNISTITASETNSPNITRITIVVNGDDENMLHQIVAQMEKLEIVRKAYVLDMTDTLYRELLLLKIRANSQERTALREIIEIYRGKIIALTKDGIIVELTGEPSKIDGFMSMVEDYDLVEVCRTGITGIERGFER